jgi:hypothetical protein
MADSTLYTVCYSRIQRSGSDREDRGVNNAYALSSIEAMKKLL